MRGMSLLVRGDEEGFQGIGRGMCSFVQVLGVGVGTRRALPAELDVGCL